MRRSLDPNAPPTVSYTGAGGKFEIVVKAPTIGLITRIPAEQPDSRASQFASNVRFDDGVARAAMGYGRLTTSPDLDSLLNLIFYGELMTNSMLNIRNVLVFGTAQKLWATTRYAEGYLRVDAGPDQEYLLGT